MSKRLLLVGGGGHCKTIIEAAVSMKYYDEIGIIDLADKKGESVLGYHIIGSDEDLLELKKNGFDEAFVSMGSVGSQTKRIQVYQNLKKIGFTIPNIIHSSSEISSFSSIQEGILIGKKVIINADSRIGIGSILNTGCIIDHDCEIGDFSHIAPGSVLCGNVTVGRETHIGANTVIRQGVRIGSQSIIGLGSVVVKNVEDNCLAFGNPCRKVESL
jgi:sugar O-acyltransferase (sialic acid O-acetyltransferase NeuD family)